MKGRKWISVLMAVVLLGVFHVAGAHAKEVMPGKESAGGGDGVVITLAGTGEKVVVKRPKIIPKDWIVEKAYGYQYVDKNGYIVTMTTVMYREPSSKPHPCPDGAYLCSYWYSGALSSTRAVGGIKEHMVTNYERHHWYEGNGGSAWYLWDTYVWWDRTDSSWDVGSTYLHSKETYGAEDCYGDHVQYPARWIGIHPTWNGNNTPYYVLYTYDQGTLAMNWPPRQHQIDPVNVYHYGYLSQLPKCVHYFNLSGAGTW